MASVQMLQSVTGGRGDGTEWPPAGGILECGEDEARDLVKGQIARWPADEERAVMPPGGAETAAGAPADGGAGEDAQDGVDSEGKPLVRDPKQAWVDHATAQGASAEAAAAMTKADLIEKYGNPPQ